MEKLVMQLLSMIEGEEYNLEAKKYVVDSLFLIKKDYHEFESSILKVFDQIMKNQNNSLSNYIKLKRGMLS